MSHEEEPMDTPRPHHPRAVAPDDALDRYLGTVKPATGTSPSNLAISLALTAALIPLPRRAALAYREYTRLRRQVRRRHWN